MNAIGATTWVIAEGYIPEVSTGPQPQLLSHETACMVNTGDTDAHVRITVFYTDREPIPRGTDYASVIESDVPIVVQRTRLDSRQPANALLSTVAYAG